MNKKHVKIDMYTTNGDFVKTFNSQVEAAQSLDLPQPYLSCILNGVDGFYTIKGYLWVTHGDDITPKVKAYKLFKNKPVTVFNLDGELLHRYDSLTDAVLDNGLSRTIISSCANNKRQRIGYDIFVWGHEEHTIKHRVATQEKIIYIYNEDGSLFGKYVTQTDAGKSLGVSRERIRQCLNDGCKTKNKTVSWRKKNGIKMH